ncbi:MAG: tetratricopeptide repeat-containing glycosyltransferase family protein [Pseudomonadales bacterium]|jgi:Flp pilus assembly protein TadD|nr:tetratricopeptide repeat-containing glycosyltransferase family protein [Pseudomonadales bacterium]
MPNPDELFHLALEHHQRGQFQQAIAVYDQVLALAPDNVEAYYNQAIALSRLGRRGEALKNYERAITLQANSHLLHFGRGNELDALGRYEEALASYERASNFKPDFFEAYDNRGNVLSKLNRHEEALVNHERGIALRPEIAELHYNRGHVLAELSRYDEALASYDRAIALKPDYAEAYHNRGFVLRNLGFIEEALAAHERAIALNPRNALALYSKALIQLLFGNYTHGFALYEWRLRGGIPRKFREFTQPRWHGEITDQIVLLHAEQGLGDSIQMLRYLPLVKARAPQLVLDVPTILHPLLGSFVEGLSLVQNSGALPPFDLHCPLMSLPFAFGTTFDTIPARVPYLTAPAERLPKWRARLPVSAKPRVGLVWSTSPNPYARHRNIALESLVPLLRLEGFSFVSLQLEYREHDLPLLAQLPIERIDDAIADFGDTAAAIEQCDLVISVDTAVAHLTGALGKALWVLLPFVADWRWSRNRNDSPWYPTARLFRQTRRDDWEGVIASVLEALPAWRNQELAFKTYNSPPS